MADTTDFRELDATGWETPSENYCDQPYVVKTDDGAWLCQMTTGHSREGRPGEHVVSMRSEDLLTEPDPGNAAWTTLPEGDIGLRNPEGGGIVAEEQSFVALDDGSLDVIYRTTDGYPAASYSRDNGRTWDAPRYATYATGGRIRNPRAACFAWKCENGKYRERE